MKKTSILYVDDEQDTLRAMKIGLEGRGYEVLTADSGKKGLDVLGSSQPDLIIADLRMEPMNGFEFFQKAKALRTHASTPFFFLTAVEDFLAQKYGQSLGVDAYLTKPVDLAHLDRLIQERLTRKR